MSNSLGKNHAYQKKVDALTRTGLFEVACFPSGADFKLKGTRIYLSLNRWSPHLARWVDESRGESYNSFIEVMESIEDTEVQDKILFHLDILGIL